MKLELIADFIYRQLQHSTDSSPWSIGMASLSQFLAFFLLKNILVDFERNLIELAAKDTCFN